MLPLNARFDEFVSWYFIALRTTVSASIVQIWNRGIKTTAHSLLNVKFTAAVTTHTSTKSLRETNNLHLLPKTVKSIDKKIR